VNRFIDHLQVITTYNYNNIAIYTLCSSLEHTVWCSHSVTRYFLLTVPTMAILLPLTSRPFYTDSRTELTTDLVAPSVFKITPRYGPRRKYPSFSYANRLSRIVFASPSNGSTRYSVMGPILCLKHYRGCSIITS
jgi:hypothetical protein